MATKYGKVVTYREEFSLFKNIVTRGHVTNQKHFISSIPMPIVTKPIRMMKYREELPPTNSHDPFVRFS